MKIHHNSLKSIHLTTAPLIYGAAIWLICLLALSTHTYAEDQARIINGQRVTANQADFYVAILQKYSWPTGSTYNPICGAMHLGEGQVVTAAHCVESLVGNDSLYLLFGDSSADMHKEYCTNSGITPYQCSSDKNGLPNKDRYHATHYATYTGDPNLLIPFTTGNVKIHEDYSPTNFLNDIALIQFNQIFNFPAASLPRADEFTIMANLNEKLGVTVIGYGDTISDNDNDTFNLSDDLLFTKLDAKTADFCRSQWGSTFNKATMICAHNENGSDTCQGDSGGPLVKSDTHILFGITSFGPIKCGSGAGVYTRVFNYIDWIELPTSVIPSTPNENENENETDINIAEDTEKQSGPFVLGNETQVKDRPSFRHTGSFSLFNLIAFLLSIGRRNHNP